MNRFHTLIALWAVATLGGAVGAQAPAARITADSIGAIPIRRPLREIVRRVPGAARDVWWGQEVGYPALRLRVGSLRVWAVQEREPAEGADSAARLAMAEPADFYAIEGAGGILPGGSGTGSPWRELRRTLGPVVVYAEPGFPIHVLPCRHSWLVVGFDAVPVTRRADGTVAPDAIPATARPAYVHLRPAQRNAKPAAQCGAS